MVLIYNKSLGDQLGKLFSNRWNGPYKVKKQLPGGSYILEELDGTELRRAFAASHIKRFYPQGRIFDEIQQEEEDITHSDSEDSSLAASNSSSSNSWNSIDLNSVSGVE